MRFGILGTTSAWRVDGSEVALGGPRSRTLLALLALDAGHFVSASRLIDGLYGDNPPEGAANALQSQVSRLRTALKELAPVEFTPAGYRLVVDPDDVDVHRFERLAREGRAHLAAGEHAQAAETLTQALALWRGPAFADLNDVSSVRLDELRADAASDRVEALLSLGRGEEVLAELRETVAAQPLRERSQAQLVRALAGRPADALAAFEAARHALADELGADPGPELAAAHLAVLRRESEQPSITALPAQLTSFVGRVEELQQVEELLGRSRLVTLTGPGGTGKTRLAVEVVSGQIADVAFVELAGHEDAGIAAAVLAALGLRDSTMNGGAQDPAERLIAALRDRATLVVLDNCEHVIEAAARLTARLLAACPGLRVLATSREPLGITGEQLAPVPRLAVPPPGTSASRALEFPAIRLFADRAKASDPTFVVDESTIGDVQHICAALDGLPLALELAAARVRTHAPGELAARLDDRFRLLARGSRTADARHRSLRGVVEWSWDLLDDDERRLARRLTVFAGGATPATASAVCGDAVDLLPSLADKSLVETSGGRFRMLETIRAFCAEQLDAAGETGEMLRAHAAFFVSFMEEADAKLRTAEQLEWLSRVDAEYDNVLAALRWATSEDVEMARRLVLLLVTYWWMRGRRFEGAVLALEVVRRGGPVEPDDEFLACLLSALAGMPDHEALAQYVPAARKIAGDVSWAPSHPIVTMLLGVVIGPPDDDAADLTSRREALMRQGDPWGWALVPTGFGLRELLAGRLTDAEEHLREGAAQFRELGERWGLSMALDHLSQVLSWLGRRDEALRMMSEALALMNELGATDDSADLLCRRAETRALTGDPDGALADYELAVALAQRSGMPETRGAAYTGMSNLARRAGNLPAARSLGERALAECTEGSFSASIVRAVTLVALGAVTAAEGRLSEAADLHRQALETAHRWRFTSAVAAALDGLAGVELLAGRASDAATFLGAAAAIRGTHLPADPDAASAMSEARALLGAAGFESAYATGLGYTTQKALTTAGVAP